MSVDPNQTLAEELHRAYPELEAIAAAGEGELYVVGGAVRDLLLGLGRSDNIDVVVEGEASAIVQALGAEALEHDRFATAKADLDGLEVDIASARTETYARPGALPDVAPGATIEADLRRRDFTLNAIAVGVGDGEVLDPFGGRADLDARLLRVLHPGSFADDPTRALRAARYGARLGFELEPETELRIGEADLGTISDDRRRSELLRIAAELAPVRALELLCGWGLLGLRDGGLELARRIEIQSAAEPWASFAPREETILRAALGPAGAEEELAAQVPVKPSDAVALAAGHDPVELALARALGADWLDDYLAEWSTVRLEIGGEDLIAAGVPEGPAVGAGLEEALRRKLDGEISGRDQELNAALETAGESR